ncbi:type IV conjugative transfer system protein TraV (plasmid) [Serratia plymuthica 4Rx13]|uniref:Type IV conjugative transfer system protein TraV n=1 Tax=Serratia plymuthica TaxID=82996 RepID=A0A318NU75_SERPL|nr:type IV conjugative transfer system lipoprotein TraV [Serratia plymuthica]AGO57698.1 type IV conjugative transfer system protein TraV [Serratia plymuthica 4Rx13]PYD36588.1 type IV conjugative transfer system protein TraV [Serratia plymuthica]
MKKLLILTVITAAAVLTGCAGMNSDFECNKTAGDACLSMTEANALARSGGSLETLQSGEKSSVKKPAGESLPMLNNTPPVLKPISAQTAIHPVQSEFIAKPINGSVNSQFNRNSVSRPVVSTSSQGASLTSNTAGAVNAYRVPDQTQRLWVAPYVDKSDAFHQPSVVEFVKNKSHWYGVDNYQIRSEEE